MSAPRFATEAAQWAADVGAYVPFGMRRLGLGKAEEPLPRPADETALALHPRRMKLTLREVVVETASTRTLRLERTDGPLPPFEPGQYVNLFLTVDGVATSRPYSISSVPGAALLDLTVKEKPGGFVSSALVRAVPGAPFESTGPAGTFRHEPLLDGARVVFLAGGSGITPFMGMLRDQERRGWPLSTELLYGTRSDEDVIFGAELERMARATDRLHFTLIPSEPSPRWTGERGLLDASLLRRLVPDLSDRTFFVCGPAAMYDLCLLALRELGVPTQRVRCEAYGPPPDVTRVPGWPEHVPADREWRVAMEDGRSFAARAGEPLIWAMERHGVVVPALCRSGECSACRTRVLEGEVFSPPHARIRESDRGHGYVHACVAYPLSDLRVRL